MSCPTGSESCWSGNIWTALRVREIAERLGDSEKAVETVLYRARREFRRLFELRRFRGVEVTRTNEQGTDISQQSQS